MPPPGTTQGQVQPYTSPNGQTVPGAQVDQSKVALNTAANAQPIPAQSMPSSLTPSSTDLNAAAGSAVGNLASMQTPQNRQAYINNSNLPAMNQNYDDLARQLYEYDKNVIGPNYTNPSTITSTDGTARVPGSPLELTDSLLGSSSFNFTNPGNAIASQTAQKGNIIDLLTTLNNATAKEFQSREGTYASTVQSQKDVVSFIKDLMQQQDTLAMKQKDLDNQVYLKKLELGLVDENGNPIDSSSVVSGSSTTGNPSTDREVAQAKFNALPAASPLRNKIAASWKSAHGYELFPGSLDDKTQGNLNNSVDTLRKIDQAIQSINTLKGKGKSTQDPVTQAMLESGLPALAGLQSGPTADLGRNLLLLQGLGDRQLMGGRLIRDLVTRFGSAFPSLNQDSDTQLKLLNNMRSAITSDMGTYSTSQGYKDPQQFLTDHGVSDITLNPTSRPPLSSFDSRGGK